MSLGTYTSVMVVAILVVLFRSILRQVTIEQGPLWLAGWTLVLIHFMTQFADVGQVLWTRVAAAISLNALELASIAFLISVSGGATDRRRQILLAAVIGIPAVVYTDAVIWDVTVRSFYYAVIALALTGAMLVIWDFYRTVTPYVAGMWIGCMALSCVVAWAVMRGKLELGIILILAALNFIVAGLFWRRFRHATAGVLTTVLGFVAWGAVFPAGMLAQTFSIHVESEVWNIPEYFVAFGMVVIILEVQVRRIMYLVCYDELTGLANRRLLEDRLGEALNRANRKGKKVAVLILDVDRFKEINDTYGHRIGDLALQRVGVRLTSRLGVSDTLARSGGDEFTIVSDVDDAHGAQVLVANLETAFAIPLNLEGNIVPTGLSIGLALYPDDGQTPDQLYTVADQAMYVSKRVRRAAEDPNSMPQP